MIGAGTSATGSRTSRDATDVAGTSNPDIESSITSAATIVAQTLEHRRFVSRPLAARTFANADGLWTWSYACSESNTNHNGKLFIDIYCWRPTTGARVGSGNQAGNATGGAMTVTAETAFSVSPTWTTTVTIQDGDILVFEVTSRFTQGMATAYTDQFAYNGTTEASTTTCASFVTPPAPLTLFTAPEMPSLVTAITRYPRRSVRTPRRH